MRRFYFLFMLRLFFVSILITVPFIGGRVNAQSNSIGYSDPYYLEDQFYLGSGYNIMRGLPAEISQRNFSYGVFGGFIRDMPFNASRTLAIGTGIGLGYYNYYYNLRAIAVDNIITYALPEPEEVLKRNKIETHLIEIPLEFRWRNSTPEDYSFWRVYTGLKLGYVFSGRSKYVGSSFKEAFSNSDLERFHYGVTLSAGYHALTLNLYYGLNRIFQEGTTASSAMNLDFRPFRFGLIFYIL